MPLADLHRLPKQKLLLHLRQLRRPVRFFNHISAAEARRLLGPEVFDAAFKISIVRNPYDKLVSQFFWDTRDVGGNPSFAGWLRRHPERLADNNSQYMIGPDTVIDFFIRYEHLEEDMRALETKVPDLADLHRTFSGISAKGSIRPKSARARDIFDGAADLVAAVRFFNGSVIQRFGYLPTHSASA